jgi:hypothetical protein
MAGMLLVLIGSLLPTILDSLPVSSSFLYVTPLKMGPRVCTEMLETNYQSMQQNIPGEWIPQPDANSVEEVLWRFHIEGLHLKYWWVQIRH